MLIIQNCLVTKEVIQYICFISFINEGKSIFSSVGIEEFKEGDVKDFKIGHQSLDVRFSDFNLTDN